MPAEQIAKIVAEEIMAKQVEELEKEKKKLQVRLKAPGMKVDHLERAQRLEEFPLLKLQYKEFKEEAKVVLEEKEKERRMNEIVMQRIEIRCTVRMREDEDKYLESLLK